MRHKFILWGSSGHAKVLAGVVRRLGGIVSATIDIRREVPAILDAPAFRGNDAFERWLSTVQHPSDYRGVICIGGAHGDERVQVFDRMRAAGLDLTPIVDPNAFVDETAILGDGSHVLAGAIVAAEVSIGEACIINHKASIDHESSVGDGVHIAPGVTVCGLVSIGATAFIGAGSVVLPRLTIGDGAFVGGGAVVIRDVSPFTTIVGNPARPISTGKS